MKALAQKHNGQCLSTIYKNAHSKLKWRCVLGHVWSATPANIKKGKWCPNCKSGHNEERCRFILEQLTGKTFLKVRSVIKGELDGYSEDLNLAFEYQGIQHFCEVPFFRQNLSEIQDNDKFKRSQCKELNLTLIEIPYLIAEKGAMELEAYLRKQLKLSNIKINGIVDYSKEKNFVVDRINQIREKDGLVCVGIDKISNGRTYVKMQCDNNHEWTTLAYSIISQKYNCPYCAGMKRTIKDVQNIARQKNGECISGQYVGATIKMQWKCSKGHIWMATLNKVLNGRWCPECAKESRTNTRRLNKGYSYEIIRSMHRRGATISEICDRFHICDKTVKTAIMGN